MRITREKIDDLSRRLDRLVKIVAILNRMFRSYTADEIAKEEKALEELMKP